MDLSLGAVSKESDHEIPPSGFLDQGPAFVDVLLMCQRAFMPILVPVLFLDDGITTTGTCMPASMQAGVRVDLQRS